MVWFGLVLIYDKSVGFGSKLFVNGLVSPIFKWFHKFQTIWFDFILNKWFGLVWF